MIKTKNMPVSEALELKARLQVGIGDTRGHIDVQHVFICIAGLAVKALAMLALVGRDHRA